MTGRVILVTGAASGIGAALAKTLSSEAGCCLLLHTRASAEKLEEVSAQCRDNGAVVESTLADIAEVGAAKSLVDACVEKFGRLDCIVANAGHADSTPLEEIDAAAFQLMFATMAQSFVELAQAALPLLRQSAAPRVVAVSSFIAHRYEEGALFVSSAAAKAALESVVRTLARVAAPDRIPVNIVVRPCNTSNHHAPSSVALPCIPGCASWPFHESSFGHRRHQGTSRKIR